MEFDKLIEQILGGQSIVQPSLQPPSSPKPVSKGDIEALAKTFGDPGYALNIPVRYRTEHAQGTGTSHGENVTLDYIIRQAKNNLQGSYGQNPQNKQRILTQTANALQDWAIGMNQDNRLDQADRIDDETRELFLDIFSNLNSTEQFINAVKLPNNFVPQPQPTPNPEEEKELEDFVNAYYDPGSYLYKSLRDLKAQQQLQKDDPVFYQKLMDRIMKHPKAPKGGSKYYFEQ